MRLGRGALVALVVGIMLILLGPLSLLVVNPVIDVVRDIFGVGRVYFASRAFLNFVSGGLLNLIAFQLFAAAAVLLALRGRTPSQYPGLPGKHTSG